MSVSVNKVILVGHVGRDPEVRYISSGAPVATFSVATDDSFKGRKGEQQQHTEWHKVVAWRKLAVRLFRMLRTQRPYPDVFTSSVA
jgi:single-strand DNA-binding protein